MATTRFRAFPWLLAAFAAPLYPQAPPPTKPAFQTNKPPAKPPPFRVSPEQVASVREQTEALGLALNRLRGKRIESALLADVECLHRAGTLLLRFSNEEFFTARHHTDALSVLALGLRRAAELEAGRASWTNRRGYVVRGYRSKVDSTPQPYGLVIPQSYDGLRPARLDVILHGRGATLSEVNFIAARELTNPAPTNVAYLRLEVYGRWNNAYRYAGEADVFEALASVRERYRIDPARIVLRGFSMGGGGAWHLGMHHPDRWAALEAGAGFTETVRFTRSSNLPAEQLRVLPIFDADPAALNCVNLPVLAYGGEEDKQLQASINMREQLMREGFSFTPDGLNYVANELRMVCLVGPKTGHKWHPESRTYAETFLDEALLRPRGPPDRVRFVTFTTRYNRCHWVGVDALGRHYDRAEITAERFDGGKRVEVWLSNITRFTLDLPPPALVKIENVPILIPAPLPLGATRCSFEKNALGWALATAPLSPEDGKRRKVHGLQGPIDDAFNEAFLCVKPSGTPWNPPIQQHALSLLDRFIFMFGKWLRGDVRVKNDAELTPADIAQHHLVLFGDPGGNKVLARILGQLPLRWTRDTLELGTNRYPSANHLPALIYPNPLNPKKYVVLNTGHTIPEKDWRGNNALQFGKWGDWAILRPQAGPGGTNAETPVAVGFFGERWEVPE